MVLTRRGSLVLTGAVAMAAAGRTLGVVELFLLAAGTGGLVVVAAVSVLARRVRLDGSRRLHPPRVHAGSESRVDLVLRNRGRWPTPVCVVKDAFGDGGRHVRLLLGPVAPGLSASTSYRLPAERRGVYQVGPLQIVRTDPFGLASRATMVSSAAELTVYPRIDDVAALPASAGRDLRTGSDHPATLSLSGDEFYGLRTYEMGDDLRRVHWPSTARLDELMIRQQEMPRQGRVAVLLDVRAGLLAGEEFEAAVSAAASVLTACWKRSLLVRLCTSDGFDSGYAGGHAQLDLVLEELAVVQPAAGGSLDVPLGRLRAEAAPAALVAVVGARIPAGDLQAVARTAHSPTSITVVSVSSARAGAWGGQGAGGPAATLPRGVRVIRVGPGAPFAEAWNLALTMTGGPALARPRRR